MNIQTINHVSDCVPLYLPQSLYLKPHAKMCISVSLPSTTAGKSISSFDAMENLRKMIAPDKFSVLKVIKSTLELIRFDAELEERSKLRNVLDRLDGSTMKLPGFSDSARIRAAEAKETFPKRHDWDSFFRDARDMDEKKAGERPDTIHISSLPIRWFCPRHQENDEVVKPSESIFKRIFEKFGTVRTVDIPVCDPHRKEMKSHMSGMKTFSFDQDLYFEAYVQFSEYLGFVRTMDEFRGMKLVRKDGEKNYAINIKVDFDTTKHLSDANIKRRKIIRDRLMAKENARLDEERKKQETLEAQKEKERQDKELQRQQEYEKQRQREEKRKEKELKKIREAEQQQISSKIKSEEKKLLIAQRKLESIRLLEALFERIKVKNSTIKTKIKKERDDSGRSKFSKNRANEDKPFDLRNKLIKRVKSVQEQEWERQKHRVNKVKKGSILGSALSTGKRSPSVNSISSNESALSDSTRKRKKKRASDSDLSLDEPTKDTEVTNPLAQPNTFPIFNPETGQWVNMTMGMGMGMYPFPPFFSGGPMMRPDFFPQQYPMRGRGGYRGRGLPTRGRGRASYRGRGGNSHDYGRSFDNYEDRDDDYDYKRKRSRDYRRRSRSDSRDSRSSRSRSRSRGRRPQSSSRSRKRRSRSRSQSKDRKSKKLVSTLRRSRSSSSSRKSKSRSRSRSRDRRSWSKRRSHSRSRSRHTPKPSSSHRSSDRSKRSDRGQSRDRSADRSGKDARDSMRSKRSVSPAKQSARSARGIRPNSQSKSKSKSYSPASRGKSNERSHSVDSSKFRSPKRKERSSTPEKEWN